MNGRRYLVLKGRTWWFQRDIPEKLRGAFGDRKTMTMSLRTSDLRVAQSRRDVAFLESEAAFRGPKRGRSDAIVADALGWAEEWRKWQEDPQGWAEATYGGAEGAERNAGLPSFVEDRAEEIRRKHGPEAERQFTDIVQGGAPLATHLEAHLREARITPRTAQERETAIRRLAEWQPRLTLRSLDRKEAGRYVSDVLAKGHPKTGNKAISNLSSYWRWLVKRGHVADNPWRDQRLDERPARDGEPERAFTDLEVAELLAAPYPTGNDPSLASRLYDGMRIAALSGARIDEICRLTVADCSGGVFDIRKSKTKAGVRKVPIHTDLSDIIARRAAGKQPGDFLFDDIEKGGAERSMPLSKQFTRYRRAVGIDDREDGQRRSRVNFHSFRRWFATKAEQAGQPPHIIEFVLGHKRPGMTLGRYSGGPSVEEQMRACVDAVSLP